MNQVYFTEQTHSPEETAACGARLARALLSDGTLPRFIALDGDLGAGKTEFVRGFAGVISPSSAVRSPTYTLVNEYRGGSIPVFHFDVYRITDEDDLYSTGFYDYPDRGICLVEWCGLIPYALPESYFSVRIEKVPSDPSARNLEVLLTERND